MGRRSSPTNGNLLFTAYQISARVQYEANSEKFGMRVVVVMIIIIFSYEFIEAITSHCGVTTPSPLAFIQLNSENALLFLPFAIVLWVKLFHIRKSFPRKLLCVFVCEWQLSLRFISFFFGSFFAFEQYTMCAIFWYEGNRIESEMNELCVVVSHITYRSPITWLRALQCSTHEKLWLRVPDLFKIYRESIHRSYGALCIWK